MIVEHARPKRRPITAPDSPRAIPTAISSRSASDNLRGDRLRSQERKPPLCMIHRINRPHIAPDCFSHILLGLTRRDTPLQLLAIPRTQSPAVLPSTSLSHHDLLSVTASLPAAEATTD